MNPGTIVKYSKPTEGEHDFRFIVMEDNGDRVHIMLICDWWLKPIEILRPEEITTVEESAP